MAIPEFATAGWAAGSQRRQAIAGCLAQWSRLVRAIDADGWRQALRDRRTSRLPPVVIELAVQLAGDELAAVVRAGIDSTPTPELPASLRQLKDRVLAGIETIRRRSWQPGPRSSVPVLGRGGQ